ncbi:hypothetical protein AAU61_19705 [Desulfocarbo indianensis]|nr:hypothetical protein AAU61_19705 [Desulfocarbo indianensis]
MQNKGCQTVFDEIAQDYDAQLEQGLSFSGEGKDYYAEGRIKYLRRTLDRIGKAPSSVLDYGCGTGTAAPLLQCILGARRVVGVDPSRRSIEEARKRCAGPGIAFQALDSFRPAGEHDLVFTNGVFHHVAPGQRQQVLACIRAALRPGGLMVIWENNIWNPGTRLLMRRLPFDRDAVPLSSLEARKMLRLAGFEIIKTNYLFVFVRALRFLRRLEYPLSVLPLGAQYQIVAQLPD